MSDPYREDSSVRTFKACKKCGWPTIEVTYRAWGTNPRFPNSRKVSYVYDDTSILAEAFTVKCQRCGYMWDEDV